MVENNWGGNSHWILTLCSWSSKRGLDMKSSRRKKPRNWKTTLNQWYPTEPATVTSPVTRAVMQIWNASSGREKPSWRQVTWVFHPVVEWSCLLRSIHTSELPQSCTAANPVNQPRCRTCPVIVVGQAKACEDHDHQSGDQQSEFCLVPVTLSQQPIGDVSWKFKKLRFTWFGLIQPRLYQRNPKNKSRANSFANGPLHRVCSLNAALWRQPAQGWTISSLKPERLNCRTELETLTSLRSPWFKAIVFAKLNCLIHVVTLTQNELSTKGTHDMPERFSILPSFAPKSNEYKQLRDRIQGNRQHGADQL